MRKKEVYVVPILSTDFDAAEYLGYATGDDGTTMIVDVQHVVDHINEGEGQSLNYCPDLPESVVDAIRIAYEEGVETIEFYC